MADNIQDRIKKLSGIFKEMQVTKVETDAEETNVIYVIVTFPPRWVIDESVEEKFDVSVREGNIAGEYYFCTDMTTGFERVFDAIDYCIQVNKDAMERAKIFQEKLLKLKEIFGNEEVSVDELRALEFTYQKPKKKPVQKKKTPIDEIAEKEITAETEDNE